MLTYIGQEVENLNVKKYERIDEKVRFLSLREKPDVVLDAMGLTQRTIKSWYYCEKSPMLKYLWALSDMTGETPEDLAAWFLDRHRKVGLI